MNKGSYRIAKDVPVVALPFGSLIPLINPAATGGKQLTIIVATLNVGEGHNFHKHPEQDEVIYVLDGKVEQWIDGDKQILAPGDAAFIPANTVHGSFTVGDRQSRLLAIFGPCVGDGFISVEVASEAPWNRMR